MPVSDFGNIVKAFYFPSLRNLPKLTLLEAHLLMSWEAGVDEPLLVQPPGHLLKDLDAARVVLDQVDVGGEDGGDAALVLKCGVIPHTMLPKRPQTDKGLRRA